MPIKTLLCSIFLFACSDSVESIVEEFYTLAENRNCYPKRLPIALVDLPDPAVGMCVPYVTMLIDSESFRKFGFFQKREVIFHELGHCVLYRDHTDDPISLMTPHMHTELALGKDFGTMLDELFSDCPYSRGL